MNKNAKFHLALETNFYDSVKQTASKENVTITEFINKALKQYLNSLENSHPNTTSNQEWCKNNNKLLNEINSKLGNFMKRGKN